MISPALCPTLTLLLIIGSVFTITLSENLQLADGFTSFSANLEYRIQPGETQMLTWGIINDDQNEPLQLEMYATGQGADLFVFEENITIEPGAIKQIEIFVIVPDDYPTDLELHPKVFAKKITIHEKETSGAKININIQHVTKPIIFIGDNPTYYAPEIIEEVIPDITTNEDKPTPTKPKVEAIPGETMAEKLARINLANELLETTQVSAPDKPFEVEPGAEYLAEPTIDAEPVSDLPKCGFWEMILSWFGIKSDCI